METPATEKIQTPSPADAAPSQQTLRDLDVRTVTPEELGNLHLKAFTAWEEEKRAAAKKARHARNLTKEQKKAQALSFRDGYEPSHPVILVLHASVGSGHRSAAIAVAQALEELRDKQLPAFPDGGKLDPQTRVVVADVLAWGDVIYDGNKYASSFTGSTRPLYDLTWRYAFTGRALWGQGTFLNYMQWRKFTRYIGHVKPLAVICTHIMGANMAAGARTICKQHYPIISVPTDYETEGLWPHKATDCFCVGTESMAETLRARKVSEQRIAITGIPTRLDFRLTYDTQKVREEFDLPQDKKVVLALAGAKLPQPYVNLRQTLDAALPSIAAHENLHLVMVCGKDHAYAEQVRALCAEHRLSNVTVFEYIDRMAELMAASDLIVTKSGGLTVTECLCTSSPMILVGRAYGQEKVNVNMLTSNGAAMHVTTARELEDVLESVDAHPERVNAMVANANVLRRPNAAMDVAKKALEMAALPDDEKPGYIPHRALGWTLFNFYWGDKPAHIR